MRDGARGARGAGFGSREKNPFSKRAGFGPRVLARGSDPGMKKPGPNPTRCHSYSWAFDTAKDSPFQTSGNYQIAIILIELN